MWGYNTEGQVGTGSNSPNPVTTPTQVPINGIVIAVSCGGYHIMSLVQPSIDQM